MRLLNLAVVLGSRDDLSGLLLGNFGNYRSLISRRWLTAGDTATPALATSRCGDLHTLLPHVLKQQDDGADSGDQHDNSDNEGKHGGRP